MQRQNGQLRARLINLANAFCVSDFSIQTLLRGFCCSIDDGVVNYIGITNNLDRRAAQHARDKGLGNIAPLINDLTRADAKAVEQVLIEQYGLSKNGDTLLNKINSVSSTNPQYAAQLARGREILINNGYKE